MSAHDNQQRKDKPVVGILVRNGQRLEVHPLDKTGLLDDHTYNRPVAGLGGATEGDIVVCKNEPGAALSVTRILGRRETPGILALVSHYEQGLSDVFNAAVHKETEGLSVPGLEDGREDLRHIPLVTVDPKTSRDFDDAIFAERTKDGGMHLIVAIADVSYYVRPGTELDKEAFSRGNSTYFPDHVVPMLPEALSNKLCSLVPNEDRAVMVYHLWIDKEGNLTDKKINRGLMRSVARCNYEEFQEAYDGKPSPQLAPLMDTVVNPVYDAWKILRAASERRGALDFQTGPKPDDSHDVIAQFAIIANVAGDMALEEARAAALHRHHAPPPKEKLTKLAAVLSRFNLRLPNDTANPKAFAPLLAKARAMANKRDGETIIREISFAQSKAKYDPANRSHFGLALPEDRGYGHHTSPIRRYSDLVNHRSLVAAFHLGPGGASAKGGLDDVAEHINETEILSGRAENAAYRRVGVEKLSRRANEVFHARVAKASDSGVTVRVFGVTGQLVTDGKTKYRPGDSIDVKITGAEPLTASVQFAPANDNAAQPQQRRPQPQPQKKTPPSGRRRHHGPKGRR